MKVSSLPRHPVDSSLPLEKIAVDPHLSEAEKIGEASRQFEAIFLRQILSAAQKPAFPSRYSSQSFSAGVYQDIMVNQLADQMSQSGGFGLAKLLQTQLTRQPDRHPSQDKAADAAPSPDPSAPWQAGSNHL
jgi:peptidoglycan hydrolase FlgJ